MEIDQHLVSRAEAKATGQTIHRIKNLVHLYTLSVEMCGPDSLNEETKRRWAERAAHAAKLLDITARTGQVPTDASAEIQAMLQAYDENQGTECNRNQ